MKYMLLIMMMMLCSCDERVMTNNPVIIDSIINIDTNNQCIYTVHIITGQQEHFPIKSINYALYSEDPFSSKFQDICGKFQINDTIKLIAEKTTYINYGYDVDK